MTWRSSVRLSCTQAQTRAAELEKQTAPSLFRFSAERGLRHGKKPQNRFFGPRELIRLIGQAQRAGMKAPREIASYVMKAKQLDETDKALVRRIRWGVTDCRKRMAARGA